MSLRAMLGRSAAATAAASMSLGVAGLLPTTASAAVVAPAASTAVQDLGSCLTSQKSGDILILMDQSGSLKQSDPEAQRVTSAKFLVSRLAKFAQSNDVDLSVAVAGFDADYVSRSQWKSVAGGDAGDALSALDDVSAENSGLDTDYWNALEGSRRELRERASGEGGSDRCQAVVMFTDGRFDVEPRPGADPSRRSKPYAPGIDLTSEAAAAQAEERGRESLCRDGGLVDQLRKSGVKLLVVGLQGDAKAADFGLVQAMSEGDGAQKCGRIQRPDVGAFTLAEDIGDLLFAFDSLSNPNQPPLEKQTPICTENGCPDGTHAVVLDSSIRSARILAGSDLASTQIEIRGPGTNAATTITSGENGRSDIGGVTAEWEWVSGEVAEITLSPQDPAAAGWPGVWSVTFVDKDAPDGAQARTNIHVEGDLAMQLADADSVEWRTGGPVEGLTFEIVRTGSSERVDPGSLVSTVKMSAVLITADGKQIPVLQSADPDKGTQPVIADLSGANPGRGSLEMTLDVTTAPASGPGGRKFSGTELSPQVTQLPVKIQSPLNYPTVASEFVDFGSTEDAGPLPGSVAVTGPGCVWLQDATVDTAPEGVDVSVAAAQAGAEKDCLRLEEGQEASLAVQLTASEAGNGSATGDLQVRIAATEDTSETVDVTVPYAADMRRPVDVAKRTGLLAALLIVGVAVPVGLLWLMSWWRARIPGRPLVHADIPVQIRGETVARSDSGGPLSVQAQEYIIVSIPSAGSRALELPNGIRLDVTVKNPLDPHVAVTAPGGAVVTSAAPDEHGARGRLPLAIHNNWILVRGGDGRFSLSFLVAGLADQRKRDQLVEDAQRRAAELSRRLAPADGGELLPVPDEVWGPSASSDGSGGGPTRRAADTPGEQDDPWQA